MLVIWAHECDLFVKPVVGDDMHHDAALVGVVAVKLYNRISTHALPAQPIASA